jgi:tetratricopeptide (TPR) repeat protein
VLALLLIVALAPPTDADAQRFLDEWQRDPARARALAPVAERPSDRVELWLLAGDLEQARAALSEHQPRLEALVAAHAKDAAAARAALARVGDAPLTAARVHAALGDVDAAIVAYENASVVASTTRERASAYCELTELLFSSKDRHRRARAPSFLDACRSSAPRSTRLRDFELEILAEAPESIAQHTRDQLESLAPRLATSSRHRAAHSLALRRLTHLQVLSGDEPAAEATLATLLERYGNDAPTVCALAMTATERYQTGDHDADGARATDLLGRCLELDPDTLDAAELRQWLLVERGRPWLLGACTLLLMVALVARWRRGAKVKT